MLSHSAKGIASIAVNRQGALFPNLLCKRLPLCHQTKALSWSPNGFSSFPDHRLWSACGKQQNTVGRSSQNVERIFVRFAGHSHWHNIRHIKESKDALKQKVSQDIVRRIKLAVRDGGSTNPKLNSALARVMEDGKAKDVSGVTMNEVLKRLEKGKDVKGSQVMIEAKGIGNCLLMIETYTARTKWTRQEVQHIMKQFGGHIGEAGTSSRSFKHKGVIYVRKETDSKLSEDQALDIAIEAGAEEVAQGQDDEGQESYEFICDPKQLHIVKKALEEHGLKPQAARLEYIPHMFTKLDEEGLEVASKMLDSLEAFEDVIRVYDNIESE